MKKLLAVLLSLVMMFSVVALPASAATETAGDITIENIEDTVEKGFNLIERIFDFVHNIVHSLSEIFDFDCPFCDGEAEAPVEPEEPEEIFGTIGNAEDLANAVTVGGTYTVEASVEVESFDIPADTKINFDLGGNTVSGAPVINNGEVAITGGTVNSAVDGINNYGKATLTDVDMNAGSTSDYAATGRANSYTEYNNVNIDSKGGGVGVVDGGKAVFNSGSVAVNSASTSGRYNFYVVGEGSELIINDGTFSFSKTLNQKRCYVYVGSGAVVIINGGTFGPASTRSGYTAGILGDGTVIIKGGTFGFNPSTWVAEGYEAVKDGSVWTVAPIA